MNRAIASNLLLQGKQACTCAVTASRVAVPRQLPRFLRNAGFGSGPHTSVFWGLNFRDIQRPTTLGHSACFQKLSVIDGGSRCSSASCPKPEPKTLIKALSREQAMNPCPPCFVGDPSLGKTKKNNKSWKARSKVSGFLPCSRDSFKLRAEGVGL